MRYFFYSVCLIILLISGISCSKQQPKDQCLYTTTDQFCNSPFFLEYEFAFRDYWYHKTGETICIIRNNSGTIHPNSAILDWFETYLICWSDTWTVDALSKDRFFVYEKWRETSSGFPNNSSPFQSVPVLLVRKGNPLKIRDWDDLARKDLRALIADPRTDSIGRFMLLAAWYHSMKKKLEKSGGLTALNDPAKANEVNLAQADTLTFLKSIFHKDPDCPPALHVQWISEQFIKNKTWDVCLTWEFFAISKQKEASADFDIIYPSSTFLVDFPITVNTSAVQKNKVGNVTTEFITYLYSDQIQDMMVKYGFRPVQKKIVEKNSEIFPDRHFLHIDDLGGWDETKARFFDPGGVCDQLFGPSK